MLLLLAGLHGPLPARSWRARPLLMAAQELAAVEAPGLELPELGLDQLIDAATETDLSNAFGLRTSMDGLRQAFDVGIRGVFDLEAFPTLPPLLSSFELLMLREQLSSVLIGLRVFGVGLLVFTVLSAVAAGLVLGDRSGPIEEACEREEEDVLLSRFSLERAARWDRGLGRAADEEEECVVEPSRLPARRLSTGLWLELVLCVLLDIAPPACRKEEEEEAEGHTQPRPPGAPPHRVGARWLRWTGRPP
jgi:hypothetical protein